MSKNTEKHVQTQLTVETYLKIREYATLHGMSLSYVIRYAVTEFIKEKNKNGNKEVIQS